MCIWLRNLEDQFLFFLHCCLLCSKNTWLRVNKSGSNETFCKRGDGWPPELSSTNTRMYQPKCIFIIYLFIPRNFVCTIWPVGLSRTNTRKREPKCRFMASLFFAISGAPPHPTSLDLIYYTYLLSRHVRVLLVEARCSLCIPPPLHEE